MFDGLQSEKNYYFKNELDGFNCSTQTYISESDTSNRINSFPIFSVPDPKPCNCVKSHCLKLYCECFARGSHCDNCNCTNCMNNCSHEEDRIKAVKLTLERNPSAFHLKTGDGENRHFKGCMCKKSRCLKNYCECYEAKVKCSNLCRCQGCQNTEDRRQRHSQKEHVHAIHENTHPKKKSTYLHIQDPASQKQNQMQLPQINQVFDRTLNPSISDLQYSHFYRNSSLLSTFFTLEVAEAACSCILAQLREANHKNLPLFVQEKVIIEEFGRCLIQILESFNGVHQSYYGQAGNSNAFQPEPCIFPTSPYLPSNIDSRLAGNDKSYIQLHETETILHSNVQNSDSTEEPKLVNPMESILENCPNRCEYLTKTYEEDEETYTATAALLNSSLCCYQNPSIFSAEVNLSEVTDTKENNFLYLDNVPSNIVYNDSFIKRTALDNRHSSSILDPQEVQEAAYGFGYSPEFGICSL
ncbi:unnamed protein product [Schistosoma turkestanicum]|nr:unnamed protein product [Schistosoma turkestanicum]